MKILDEPFFSITKTEEELSIVLPETAEFQGEKVDSGWGCFMVHGPLDFGLTGILSSISKALSDAEISIFAISTFDTDYILVKEDKMKIARKALVDKGYNVFLHNCST